MSDAGGGGGGGAAGGGAALLDGGGTVSVGFGVPLVLWALSLSFCCCCLSLLCLAVDDVAVAFVVSSLLIFAVAEIVFFVFVSVFC